MKKSNAERFEMKATDFFIVSKKFDPNQPRDEEGQWVKGSGGTEHWVGKGKPPVDTDGRTFTSDEGYQWHEQGPVAEWAKNLPYKDAKALDNYAGFGYSEINNLRRGQPPTQTAKIRVLTPEEHTAIAAAPTGVDVQKMVPPEGKGYRYSWAYEYANDTPSGPEKLKNHWAVVGPVVDQERLKTVTEEANKIDDLIANRGYELPEAITVERGAYLPGVSPKDLENMVGGVHEEKGFTSTMVGEAGRRAHSYPALGKWESIYKRYPNQPIAAHQDEVGVAVRFHIVLPKGTKVASVESVRRLEHDFPQKPNPEPMPERVKNDPWWQEHPEAWTVTDYDATPTVKTTNLAKPDSRSESEVLLGSGARFRVKRMSKGYSYSTTDPSLKPVQTYEVYLEYIGGGSSQGRS